MVFRLKQIQYSHLAAFVICLMMGAYSPAFAQKKTSFLQLFGSVQDGSRNLGGAQLQAFENGNLVQTVSAKENGSFVIVFDLGKEYTLVFSKPGYVSKSIEIRTLVPPDAADIGYVFKCNVDLPEDIMGLSKSDPMSKPIAKIAYNAGYDDFDYDAIYTRRIKEEQAQAVKEAATLKLEAEKERLDSLNKIWSDSIAQVKAEQAAAAAARASLDKARQDSIVKAQAEAGRAAAAEKARQDSLQRAEIERKRQEEIAKEKAKQDSIEAAMAEVRRQQEELRLAAIAVALEKAKQDSISKAQAEAARLAEVARKKAAADSLAALKAAKQKAIDDSLAVVEAARLAAIKAKADEDARLKALAIAKAKAEADSMALIAAAEQRKKQEADSIVRAQQAQEARKKFVADSIARADEEAKAAVLAAQKAREDSAEAVRNAELERIQDSLAAVAKEEKDKAEAERQARILEDIQAKKNALARVNQADTAKSTPEKATTAVPKIRESDYHEGVTDETINESNRTIERTVVKQEGETLNYQKITYNWGGVFYFKDEQSITSTLFYQELRIARKKLGK